MSARVAILDYGMGNLRSVAKALEHVGARPELTSDHGPVRAADGVVLPGVGAMPRAMEHVRRLGLDDLLRERVEAGVPVIGVCMGMQLLFESTTELGGAEGIGLIGWPGGAAGRRWPEGAADRLEPGGLARAHGPGTRACPTPAPSTTRTPSPPARATSRTCWESRATGASS